MVREQARKGLGSLEKWQFGVKLSSKPKVNTCGFGGGRGCHWKDTEAVLGREVVLVGGHTGCGGQGEAQEWGWRFGVCLQVAALTQPGRE